MIVNCIPITRLPRGIIEEYSYTVPEKLQSDLKKGQIIEVPFRKKHIRAVITDIRDEEAKTDLKKIISLFSPVSLITPLQITIAKWITENYFAALPTVVKSIAPEIPKRMEDGKYEMADKKKSKNKKRYHEEMFLYKSIEEKNSHILKQIYNWSKSNLLQSAICNQVLWLTPTHRRTEEIKSRLADQLINWSTLFWHNTTNKKQRFQDYLQVLHLKTNNLPRPSVAFGEGETPNTCIIGTRSALFAPFQNLKLIILEDEHDQAYKSDQTPRYHTREVAQQLARLHNAQLIYLTPSPSVEVYHQCKDKIKTITNKAAMKQRNNAIVVDIKEERLKKNYSSLSESLQESIHKSLSEEHGVFLFLNRRGHSTSIMCEDCGTSILCPTCELPLTFHANNRLICHHCRHREDIPPLCSSCNSPNIKPIGKGTQKIEQEIEKLFPNTKIIRLDSDNPSPKIQNLNPKTSIIVGTQYALPRIDWAGITTIGIINADTALYRPDFRSSERTYQLLMQLNLKSQISNLKSFIIQTSNPDLEIFKAITSNKPEVFYDSELKLRQALKYPPYYTVLKLIYRHKEEKKAIGEAMHIYNRLKKHLLQEKGKEKEETDVIKPFPAYIRKSSNKYHFHLIVRIKNNNHTKKTIQKINTLIPPDWVIDKDPETLL